MHLIWPLSSNLRSDLRALLMAIPAMSAMVSLEAKHFFWRSLVNHWTMPYTTRSDRPSLRSRMSSCGICTNFGASVDSLAWLSVVSSVAWVVLFIIISCDLQLLLRLYIAFDWSIY